MLCRGPRNAVGLFCSAATIKRKDNVAAIALRFLIHGYDYRPRYEIGRVRPFPLCLLNQLTVDLDFCMYLGYDHRFSSSPPWSKTQGHRSRSGVRYLLIRQT